MYSRENFINVLSNISFTWARLKFDFKPVMLNLDFLAFVNNDYIYNNNNNYRKRNLIIYKYHVNY